MLEDAPPPTHRRTPFEWALALIACGLGVVNIGLGLALAFGAPLRTAAVSFDNIRAVAPVTGWGTAFVITGVVALLCQSGQWFRVLGAAHFCAGIMCLFWAGAFLLGVLQSPVVSLTGVAAYAGLGWAHIVIAATTART